MRRLRERGESLDALVIRDATPADVPALARLHVTTWNATYRPMGARGPGVEVRARQWEAAFARADPDWFCLVVARPDGELVGFAQANRADDGAPYAGELGKLHLLRDYQRLGIGRRLVGRVARRLLARGIASMWLFGDPRNPSSRAWVRMGAHEVEPGSGNYGWHDVRPLARFDP